MNIAPLFMILETHLEPAVKQTLTQDISPALQESLTGLRSLIEVSKSGISVTNLPSLLLTFYNWKPPPAPINDNEFIFHKAYLKFLTEVYAHPECPFYQINASLLWNPLDAIIEQTAKHWDIPDPKQHLQNKVISRVTGAIQRYAANNIIQLEAECEAFEQSIRALINTHVGVTFNENATALQQVDEKQQSLEVLRKKIKSEHESYEQRKKILEDIPLQITENEGGNKKTVIKSAYVFLTEKTEDLNEKLQACENMLTNILFKPTEKEEEEEEEDLQRQQEVTTTLIVENTADNQNSSEHSTNSFFLDRLFENQFKEEEEEEEEEKQITAVVTSSTSAAAITTVVTSTNSISAAPITAVVTSTDSTSAAGTTAVVTSTGSTSAAGTTAVVTSTGSTSTAGTTAVVTSTGSTNAAATTAVVTSTDSTSAAATTAVVTSTDSISAAAITGTFIGSTSAATTITDGSSTTATSTAFLSDDEKLLAIRAALELEKENQDDLIKAKRQLHALIIAMPATDLKKTPAITTLYEVITDDTLVDKLNILNATCTTLQGDLTKVDEMIKVSFTQIHRGKFVLGSALLIITSLVILATVTAFLVATFFTAGFTLPVLGIAIDLSVKAATPYLIGSGVSTGVGIATAAWTVCTTVNKPAAKTSATSTASLTG